MVPALFQRGGGRYPLGAVIRCFDCTADFWRHSGARLCGRCARLLDAGRGQFFASPGFAGRSQRGRFNTALPQWILCFFARFGAIGVATINGAGARGAGYDRGRKAGVGDPARGVSRLVHAAAGE